MYGDDEADDDSPDRATQAEATSPYCNQARRDLLSNRGDNFNTNQPQRKQESFASFNHGPSYGGQTFTSKTGLQFDCQSLLATSNASKASQFNHVFG